MPVFFSVLTFFSTLGGGLFALHYQKRMHLLLGFTGGVLLGVVAFDVLPEIMRGVAASGVAPEHFMGALALVVPVRFRQDLRHADPSRAVLGMTLAGVGFVFVVGRWI